MNPAAKPDSPANIANNLTARAILILILSPYEEPHFWNGGDRMVAYYLEKKGLLERQPEAYMFRQTELGERVVKVINGWFRQKEV